MKPLLLRFLLAATVSTLSACAMNANTPSSSHTPMSDAATTAPATLSAYHWDLAEARDASGAEQTTWVPPKTRGGAPLRLDFSDQRLSVSGLCNRLGGSYSVDTNKITISSIVGTMMACNDEGVMQYEQAVGQRLPQATVWKISESSTGPRLTLGFTDGAQWTLAGTPTDATRYGSTGEIQFLEVASQRVACSHPLIPNMQCLNVREIQYDATGIKTGQGDWQAFYNEIEGYVHQPGVRNVLRIKRYERAQVPADASRYAYVLDMVVESAQE
ncbi:DUF4377 domain-containing protein [Bordetella tumulicola]|uniref:DUF4377 domain-containing protein n=1 Tax=Bordetella tumulicola TaxID=1649133 RepID=UPI0039EFF3FA